MSSRAASAVPAHEKPRLRESFSDPTTMPQIMRQLAVVQFFSWLVLFLMWIYATPAITGHIYHTTEPTSPIYNDGADW